MKPIYVVSTGRAGSTYIARMLSGSGGAPAVSHQLPRSRPLNILGNLAMAGRIPESIAITTARRIGFDGSSTADPLRSMIIVAAVRAGWLGSAKFVHVVRDPRTFVTSFMNWKAASVKRRILHHAVPAWQPNPWLSRKCSLAQWVTMSKFEHFSWIWNYKNRLFSTLSDKGEYRSYRFEDLTAGRPDVIADLGSFIEVDLKLEARPRDRTNSSEGRFPGWMDWSPEQAAIVQGHCGELMVRFGYGGEERWHELCHIPVSRVHSPVG